MNNFIDFQVDKEPPTQAEIDATKSAFRKRLIVGILFLRPIIFITYVAFIFSVVYTGYWLFYNVIFLMPLENLPVWLQNSPAPDPYWYYWPIVCLIGFGIMAVDNKFILGVFPHQVNALNEMSPVNAADILKCREHDPKIDRYVRMVISQGRRLTDGEAHMLLAYGEIFEERMAFTELHTAT